MSPATAKTTKKPGRPATAKTTGSKCTVTLRNKGNSIHTEEITYAAAMKMWPKLSKLLADIEGGFTFTVTGER